MDVRELAGAGGGRRAGRALGAAGLALVLAGCVRVDTDLTVRADDRVSGTIVMAVDRSFAQAGDGSQEALVDEVRRRVLPGAGRAMREEPYAADRYVGTRVLVDGMSLADFDRATGADGLKIVHQGGRFKLSGTVDTSGMAQPEGSADARRLASSFDVTIRVTFPGRVLRSNGRVDGRTVAWRPRLGERVDLDAESEEGAGLPWPWLLVGLLAAGAVGALVSAARLRRAG